MRLVPGKAIVWHCEPAELRDNIAALSDFSDVDFPLSKYLFALLCIWPDSEWSAEVVEDHCGSRHCTCQLEEFLVLIVIVPRIVGESSFAKKCNTSAKISILVQILRGMTRNS